MGFGGPVWHASVMARRPMHDRELRRIAHLALAGVGDRRLGEWEQKERAFHLRRRLSRIEQQRVGDVVDIRCTPEARRRAVWVPDLEQLPIEVLSEELGGWWHRDPERRDT